MFSAAQLQEMSIAVDQQLAAARRDLCEEGGVLYEQWQKYADLENERTLAFVGGVLGTMGLTGGTGQAVAIAVTVILLHLGVKTVCEEYGEK
jgi:hypothetical protein